MTKMIRGIETAEYISRSLIGDVKKLSEEGLKPTLAILRVGGKRNDISYEQGAMKRCTKIGIAVKSVVLPEQASQEEVVKRIELLNSDKSVHGILMMRPLPAHIDDEVIRRSLSPEKDVDGITYESLAGIITGRESAFAPCTAQACVEILNHLLIDVKGKHITIVGSSLVIGKPVAMMLLNRFATVSICHIFTKDLSAECRAADIIIAAAGCPKLIGREHVKEGQIILDVGINVDEKRKICGDVNKEAVSGIVDILTAVPGGVGAVTTAVLAKHVVQAAKNSR